MIRVLYRSRLYTGSEGSLERAWSVVTHATQPGTMCSTLLSDPTDPTAVSGMVRWLARPRRLGCFQPAPSPAKEWRLAIPRSSVRVNAGPRTIEYGGRALG